MAEYYCLVAGLTDYGFDADRKSLNYTALREEIMETITKKDRAKLELLMGFYDIQNIVQFLAGRQEMFTYLGNFSSEQITRIVNMLNLKDSAEDDYEESLKLPKYIQTVLDSILDTEWAEENEIDMTIPLDIRLYNSYYDYVSKKDKGFIKAWCNADCNIRNITAAYKARQMGQDITKYLIGKSVVNDIIAVNSSSDFGLKTEVPFVEELISILSNDNIMKKESDLDMLRIKLIDDMNTFNYFNINVILGYYLKIAMIERWLNLDSKFGKEVFEKIVRNLSKMDFTEKITE